MITRDEIIAKNITFVNSKFQFTRELKSNQK